MKWTASERSANCPDAREIKVLLHKKSSRESLGCFACETREPLARALMTISRPTGAFGSVPPAAKMAHAPFAEATTSIIVTSGRASTRTGSPQEPDPLLVYSTDPFGR